MAAVTVITGASSGIGAALAHEAARAGRELVLVARSAEGLAKVADAIATEGRARPDTIALDLSEDKLTAARAFGATHAFNPVTTDAAAEIMALTGGRGVDYVFVTVGAKAAFDGAFSYLTKNGAVVIVGMPPSGVMASYDPGTMAAWNQRIFGSKMGETDVSRDIPMLVDHYRAGRLKLDELVSARYPLAQINEAIAAVNAGKALRNVIVF